MIRGGFLLKGFGRAVFKGDTLFGEPDSVNCSRAFSELGSVRSSREVRLSRSGRGASRISAAPPNLS